MYWRSVTNFTKFSLLEGSPAELRKLKTESELKKSKNIFKIVAPKKLVINNFKYDSISRKD